VNVSKRLLELLFVPLSEVSNSVSSVESLSDGFVSFDKLIKFLGQVFVLSSEDSDMVV
jgi:hypothetical protein